MADIAKCNGERSLDACPVRESCRRYTEPASGMQTMIGAPEIEPCPMYWDTKQEALF